MPVNWPPVDAPPWPPPEISDTWFSASDWRALAEALLRKGFTHRAPTAQERNAYFRDAQCDDGHNVIGRMIVSPGGTAYPFAACNSAQDRELLVLWPPYSCGWLSGPEAF